MIDISKLDKADILRRLYNNSHPLGLGILNYDPTDMSLDEAREILQKQTRFDYFNGRVMKIDLSSNELEERLYDRDNGKGAALAAIMREEVC